MSTHSAMKAYFNIDEFRSSDKKYNWTLEELAKLAYRVGMVAQT